MRVVREVFFVFFLLLLNNQLCHFRKFEKFEINDECVIPNQNKTRGICLRRQDCAEYEELFNVTDLGVERLSFIIHLDCGFDYISWKTLVCCPKQGNNYKYVVLLL